MKKFFFATLAIVAIASCTKNEVLPVIDEPQEITFQTVETKDASAFSTSNKFYSYAYFLPSGNTWGANSSVSEPYITNALISYVGASNAWKAGTPYYWPKKGSLTFFAWTDNTNAPNIEGATVSCSNTQGITVDSYDITQNKNVDFLVADVVADETSNTHSYGTWVNGVPTVFKHALSKLEFVVKTVKNSVAHDYDADKVTFMVKSIVFTGVNNKMSYKQGITEGNSSHTWENPSPAVELTNLPIFTSSTGTKATGTGVKLAPGSDGYYIVIPQNFDDDDKLIISYDIITEFISGTPVTETVTEEVLLKTVYAGGWKATTKYTLTISLGVNEILWDPAQTDWTDGTDGSVSL